MAAQRQVLVPDIGDFESVDVIEVLVTPGDRVSSEQSIITPESDKATMEIPAPCAGVVKALQVAVGDEVSAGSRILVLEVSDEDAAAAPESVASSSPAPQAETGAIEAHAAPSGFAAPEMPEIDFSRWGEVELKLLGKMRRVSARNVHRAWLTAPQVTQFDEANITERAEGNITDLYAPRR